MKKIKKLESSKVFCHDWGGFTFVFQNMHNTKILGVGHIALCGFFFPKIFTKRECYINRKPMLGEILHMYRDLEPILGHGIL